eukprot:TRINITY_DN322_c0_g1_i1.p1 TRINITY_DN322_c0_g1~~TRINITY_DN322_c0_g1_i1.p1  ORF type:complete len:130 (+),score=21.64 TRINITY_DN322_c0_g1_i1:231-620(+)
MFNIYTLSEMKLAGNCLNGSRALLTFDKNFDSTPHLTVIKGLLTHAFGIPDRHRKVKSFIDHIMSFYVIDDLIYIRFYQIMDLEINPHLQDIEKSELTEIGPRCCLKPLQIFAGSFFGSVLWDANESSI